MLSPFVSMFFTSSSSLDLSSVCVGPDGVAEGAGDVVGDASFFGCGVGFAGFGGC